MTGLPTNPKPQYATKKEKEEIFGKLKKGKKYDIKKTIEELVKISEENKKLEEQFLLRDGK